MSNMLKIGFLGGGKMAQAMAKGFISAGLTKCENMTASFHPSDLPNIEAFKSFGAQTFTENVPVVKRSDVIFVSVKPTVVPTVLENVRSESDGKLFISIAMGVTLADLEQSLSSNARVIRVMPNTPALVRSGASVYVRGKTATPDDCSVTQKLFEAIGTCEEVAESMMDPVTALSGSGPAYIFVLIESLADGGVRMGLPRDLAYRLAAQTFLGAGQLVRDTGRHPGQLKDDVTSPAGSTAAGLAFLEQNAFRHAVAGAVEAATLRCREVSGNK
uniref:Pyrroline-5-carboxylate reductase n=1 Tax=Aedes aegypti TaxID=7159 RepID=Q2KQA0_AEDAE|nr:pyrroline-5-carboxylate reductase [Aedes aegypti]